MNTYNKIISYINKNIILFSIFCFLSVTLIRENDTINSIFYIVKENYHQRLSKNYNKIFYSGFCEKQSHGYIIHIKENFKHLITPKIINFDHKRIPYWIFEDSTFASNVDKKRLILLNYQKSKNKNIDFSKYEILDNYYNSCFFLEKK
jgi:hypothetical protein